MVTKTHFLKVIILSDLNDLRAKGYSFKAIAKLLSYKYKKHFSVGLVHKAFKEQ